MEKMESLFENLDAQYTALQESLWSPINKAQETIAAHAEPYLEKIYAQFPIIFETAQRLWEDLTVAFILIFLLSLPLITRYVLAATIPDFSKDKTYTDIEPLTKFDWKNEKPIGLRPFKPTYHLTMALEKLPFSEMIAMDQTYKDRIKFRRETMKQNPSETVRALPGTKALVDELYTWLILYYLPGRFPNVFMLIVPPSQQEAERNSSVPMYLRNRILNESIPITPPEDPEDALRMISSHVDTDFLILDIENRKSPEQAINSDEKYHLAAFAVCCPSGWSPAEKLGLDLADIHGPVPGYGDKLEKSMERYFGTMPAGKMVRRANWTIQAHDRLFTVDGNHFANGKASPEEIKKMKAQTKAEDLLLRAERQTLHRLEQTGALCFAFKTYLYPLSEIKAEGKGEDLAEAIEGLERGSVPEMATYKRQVVWGEKAAAYLRA